jgi:hypothetical protein
LPVFSSPSMHSSLSPRFSRCFPNRKLSRSETRFPNRHARCNRHLP